MSNQTNKLTQAYAAFQQGNYLVARERLADCSHPQAAHLRGLVERRLGHFELAMKHLEVALEAEPRSHEIYHNQALVLLDLERAADAIERVSRAIEFAPEFVAAHRTLGRALRMAGQWEQALGFYRQFLQRWPNELAAQYGLGISELETGHIEASLARFRELIRRQERDASIHFMLGRAALEAGQVSEARESLSTAHRLAPTALTLRELGRLFWMQRDTVAFSKLLEGSLTSPDMTTVALQLLRQSGASIDRLKSLMEAETAATADQESVVAQACIDAGQADRALQFAQSALVKQPNHDAAMAARISALLMQGDAQEALILARQKREQRPVAQQWIAYESTALRLLGSSEYRALLDVSHHVQVFTLPVPEGFQTLDAFNQAFESSLERLQLFDAQPIDQSLRSGTQTARDLRSVADPVIQAYIKALDKPVREYMASIGRHADHPLSQRNTGDFHLKGCWSVRLSGGGHHVNHMHPEGWISSAYYVRVAATPPGTRSGWIHFSQPPFSTRPELEPERWIEPKAGMLVLFPSYLWHGTEPIVDDAVRVTAPFDALPREQR